MDDFATKTLKLTQQHLMTMTHQARGRRSVAQICLVGYAYCVLMNCGPCGSKTVSFCPFLTGMKILTNSKSLS